MTTDAFPASATALPDPLDMLLLMLAIAAVLACVAALSFALAVFFAAGKEVTGEAGGAARHRETIAARELQAVVQEIVDLLPEAPVAAIDRGGANAAVVETHRTLVNRGVVSGSHVPLMPPRGPPAACCRSRPGRDVLASRRPRAGRRRPACR